MICLISSLNTILNTFFKDKTDSGVKDQSDVLPDHPLVQLTSMKGSNSGAQWFPSLFMETAVRPVPQSDPHQFYPSDIGKEDFDIENNDKPPASDSTDG
jgi:hypothetical protein